MTRLTTSLLFLTFVVGACSSGRIAAESAPTQNLTPIIAQASASAMPKPKATETAAPAREAVLSEIENTVMARVLSDTVMVPASDGMSIYETGGVETSDGCRVRVDLLPDGTIVRVGPNSSFTVTAITKLDGEPKTILELFFGQVYILLMGGSLDVETVSGAASVRGSLMSVTLSTDQTRMTITCLEGHCTIKDADEELDLIAGQAADIVNGELEDNLREMFFEELGLWMLNNPDLNKYMQEFPALSDLPDGFDWNYDFQKDTNFDFFFEPEFNPGDRIVDPNFGLPNPGSGLPGDGDRPGRGDGNPPGPRN